MKRSKKRRKLKRINNRLRGRNCLMAMRCDAADRVVANAREQLARQNTVTEQALKLASVLIARAGSVTVGVEELNSVDTGKILCELQDEGKSVRYFIN